MLSDWFHLPLTVQFSPPRSLYFSLVFECLSALVSGITFEFGAKDADQAMTPVNPTGRVLPPPFKKARLADGCPYGISDPDLLLQLDDGTVVPANREAVAGAEASQVSSDYFRALLRGGFGESQAETDEAIPIKGVSTGMLLPVLHYLHGCCLARERADGERRGRCPVLDALVLKGLGHDSTEELVFQTTPLGETMIGASRFLVTELQRDLENLCVSLLISSSYKTFRKDTVQNVACKPAKENLESTEDNLVHGTSELELTGDEEDVSGQRKGKSSFRQQPDADEDKSRLDARVQTANGGDISLDRKMIKTTRVSQSEDAPLNEPVSPENEEPMLKPKLVKSATQLSCESTLAALLPQLYWFSQQHSYPALGRACLSLLLGCQGSPQLFSSPSLAADCLRRLAGEGGCTETLKKDLLSLATAALSGLDKKGS